MASTPEYIIVTGSTSTQLEREVNLKMFAGWRPLGGVSIAYDCLGNPEYCQAMTKG